MNKQQGRELIEIKDKILKVFTKSDWQELGYSLGVSKIIEDHDRLLRSLYFNDDDYEGNILAVLSQIIKVDDSNFQDIKEFVTKKYQTKNQAEATAQEKQQLITRYLNSEYVKSKINLMNKSVETDTDLAIGTAKELLETVCKSILKQSSITADSSWDLPKLVKETNKVLDFKPDEADNPQDAERSVKQIFGGSSVIIQGVAELRNAYGSGHGKEADFKALETSFAKLVTGLVSELVIFYLHVNGERTELVE